MSLENTTILDETAETLTRKAAAFMELSVDLWIKVKRKRMASKRLLKKIKTLAREINEICEELP